MKSDLFPVHNISTLLHWHTSVSIVMLIIISIGHHPYIYNTRTVLKKYAQIPVFICRCLVTLYMDVSEDWCLCHYRPLKNGTLIQTRWKHHWKASSGGQRVKKSRWGRFCFYHKRFPHFPSRCPVVKCIGSQNLFFLCFFFFSSFFSLCIEYERIRTAVMIFIGVYDPTRKIPASLLVLLTIVTEK